MKNLVYHFNFLIVYVLTSLFIANTYSQGSNQCVKIDFESIENETLYEGLPIGNQFFDKYGVSFQLENGAIPLLAQVGGTTASAFGSNYGNDTPAPGQNVGKFFITDDGKLATSNLIAIPLIVNFDNPVDSVAADVLDMDFDEIFTVTARDKNGNTLLTKTIKAGEVGTGDGIATTFGFNMPGCKGSIYSLKFQGTRQVSGGFGFAMDNFTFCFSGIDIENAIEVAVVEPNCIDTLGKVTLTNNGDFDLKYSLDSIEYLNFSQISSLGAGSYKFYIKSDDGCGAQIDVNIPELIYPNIQNTLISKTRCGLNNGSILINTNDDQLRYSLDNKPFVTTSIFENLAPGNYTVVIKNELECTDTLKTVIQPSIPVVISALKNSKDICKKNTGTIDIDMLTTGNYFYFLNDREISSPRVDSLKAGEYKITVKDDKGCTLDTIITISSTPDIILSNIVSTPSDCTDQNGAISISVFASGSATTSYINNQEIVDNSLSNLSPGVYELKVVDEYGCEVRSNIDVERGKCPVFLPNIINGNSTSFNNFFNMKTLDDYDLAIIKYRIYDRWGNLVFISGGFSIHDDGNWWDGYFKTKKAESGVYAYVIEVKHPNGEIDYLKGDVTLIW